MLVDNIIDWTTEWKQAGIQEGIAKGRMEGEAAVVKRLLTRRFGPFVYGQH